ncbi:hypothetical protein OF83DRAFT_1172059 [Amylostereum chailletii]|nr:hypothetical protein OF83DRAFT_1172059 [Amylostereum chailletii]
MSQPPPYLPPQEHPKFFLTDDMVVLQVEYVLFRVRRHFLFVNSSVLRKTIRSAERQGQDGSSKEKTIYVPEATVPQFETLLKYFYEGMDEGFSMPTHQWIDLLIIADRFHFQNIKPRAIREVYDAHPPLDPVHLVELYEEHDVPREFLLPALRTLVARAEPLKSPEISRMSSGMVAYIRKTLSC